MSVTVSNHIIDDYANKVSCLLNNTINCWNHYSKQRQHPCANVDSAAAYPL